MTPHREDLIIIPELQNNAPDREEICDRIRALPPAVKSAPVEREAIWIVIWRLLAWTKESV